MSLILWIVYSIHCYIKDNILTSILLHLTQVQCCHILSCATKDSPKNLSTVNLSRARIVVFIITTTTIRICVNTHLIVLPRRSSSNHMHCTIYFHWVISINLRGCLCMWITTRMATDQFKKQNKDSLRLLHCISFHLLLEGSNNNYDSIIKLIVDNFLIIIFKLIRNNFMECRIYGQTHSESVQKRIQ